MRYYSVTLITFAKAHNLQHLTVTECKAKYKAFKAAVKDIVTESPVCYL